MFETSLRSWSCRDAESTPIRRLDLPNRLVGQLEATDDGIGPPGVESGGLEEAGYAGASNAGTHDLIEDRAAEVDERLGAAVPATRVRGSLRHVDRATALGAGGVQCFADHRFIRVVVGLFRHSLATFHAETCARGKLRLAVRAGALGNPDRLATASAELGIGRER